MKHLTLAAVVLLSSCGGSSPSTPTPPTTTLPPARDGVVVLNGAIGGTFTLSSSPARLSGGRFFGCGDAETLIPYRETAGGTARGGDWQITLLEHNGDFARRVTGNATNITVAPNESGTLRHTEGSVCMEYTASVPPRAQVVFNFGGTVHGTVSRLEGIGRLTVR